MYFNSANGERIKDVMELRDVEWASFTMPVGWPVQGLWSLTKEGVTVDALDRSPAGTLLAAGSATGELLVTSAPCLDYSKRRTIRALGHSGAVANVRIAQRASATRKEIENGELGELSVVSVGGTDRSLLLWKLTPKYA